MTTVFSEAIHAAEAIVSEANGNRSREDVTIGAGADLSACTVLGKVTASGKYVQLAPAAADGSETAAAMLIWPAAAASADVAGAIIARDAELNDNVLVWPDGIAAADKTAAIASLATFGIIVRS